MLGNPAPDFTLQDQDGRMHSLSDHRGSWVVLYFYPKDMTPGCTTEAQEFRDHEYELADENAVVLGVSADDVSSHKTFCQELSLNFTLLSDPDAQVCRMYDVWREKSSFGAKHEGIERTTFLIDPAGKVAKLYSSVKPIGHAAKVIEDIRKLVEKASS
ncbi:MAG: thioredoxin-dependent thiol peroxidase [Patescibacteria group bacterium]|nr:thioredoxin-dependent thiol peroxidase [Patescibacteria group bacterium]MDE2116700.1 thioredoxin-dependent thiol peroxidase [Patescibacteria group bacterium]